MASPATATLARLSIDLRRPRSRYCSRDRSSPRLAAPFGRDLDGALARIERSLVARARARRAAARVPGVGARRLPARAGPGRERARPAAGARPRRPGDRAPDRARRRHGRLRRLHARPAPDGALRVGGLRQRRRRARPPAQGPPAARRALRLHAPATASPPSTPRSAGSGCCSATTSSSPRRRARSRSTAPRSSRCARRPGRSTASAPRARIARRPPDAPLRPARQRARGREPGRRGCPRTRPGRWGPLRFLGRRRSSTPTAPCSRAPARAAGLAVARGRPARRDRAASRVGIDHLADRRPDGLRAAAARRRRSAWRH